jgi:hypothetical protein
MRFRHVVALLSNYASLHGSKNFEKEEAPGKESGS